MPETCVTSRMNCHISNERVRHGCHGPFHSLRPVGPTRYMSSGHSGPCRCPGQRERGSRWTWSVRLRGVGDKVMTGGDRAGACPRSAESRQSLKPTWEVCLGASNIGECQPITGIWKSHNLPLWLPIFRHIRKQKAGNLTSLLPQLRRYRQFGTTLLFAMRCWVRNVTIDPFRRDQGWDPSTVLGMSIDFEGGTKPHGKGVLRNQFVGMNQCLTESPDVGRYVVSYRSLTIMWVVTWPRWWSYPSSGCGRRPVCNKSALDLTGY